MIRTRRYVSVAAGKYPAPVLPGTESQVKGGAVALAPEPAEPSVIDYVDDFPLPEEAQTPDLPEAIDDVANLVEEQPAVSDLPEEPAPRKSKPRRPMAGILLGGLLGIVLGAVAGALLLVFSSPTPEISQAADPVLLWQSTSDPLVKTAAVLIAAGFVLLGVGLGAWSRRSSR